MKIIKNKIMTINLIIIITIKVIKEINKAKDDFKNKIHQLVITNV